MSVKSTTKVHTPVYYPPWFASYRAFRVHIRTLVARKEAAIRKAGAAC